jgi:hypothetical protein
MAKIVPILYEVIPSSASPDLDYRPWVLMIGRLHDDSGMFIQKGEKLLNSAGVWVDGGSDYTDTPPDCIHSFRDAVTLAIREVDTFTVDGKTYGEHLNNS